MQFNDAVFICGLAVINIIGLWFSNYFRTLVFLDTIATAMAAFAGIPVGPWSGALVGLITNVLIGLKYPSYWKFLHVNVLCGCAWGLTAKYFPLQPGASDQQLFIYLVLAGTGAGFLSAALSVPVRLLTGFKTDHLLDQVSHQIRRKERGLGGIIRIFFTESALSHILDKTISTTVGVLLLLQFRDHRPNLAANYHDMIELLAAAYFVAMGYSIKTLKLNYTPDEVVALLGPLGFFAVLIALPVLIRSLGVN